MPVAPVFTCDPRLAELRFHAAELLSLMESAADVLEFGASEETRLSTADRLRSLSLQVNKDLGVLFPS